MLCIKILRCNYVLKFGAAIVGRGSNVFGSGTATRAIYIGTMEERDNARHIGTMEGRGNARHIGASSTFHADFLTL
jgi:hypothetical protein